MEGVEALGVLGALAIGLILTVMVMVGVLSAMIRAVK